MLSSLQDALDDLTQHLTAVESELQRCKSVGDLLVADLQRNIDNTLASFLVKHKPSAVFVLAMSSSMKDAFNAQHVDLAAERHPACKKSLCGSLQKLNKKNRGRNSSSSRSSSSSSSSCSCTSS